MAVAPGERFNALAICQRANASFDALEPCPPSYLVIGFLRLLVQFKPDLIAIATVVKHHVGEP
jgi:hypothetical protein